MSSKFITFRPAEYYHKKDCYVGYYVEDPSSGKLKRVKIKLNHIHGARERAKYARHLIDEINRKLYAGENPLLEKVARNASLTIREACQRFMIDKSDLRPDSLRSYRSYTNILLSWCQAQTMADVYCCKFDKSAARRFMAYIAGEGRSARTYNNYLHHYQSMFNYLADIEVIVENPFADIKSRKTDHKLRKIIPKEDRKRLIDYCLCNNMQEYIVIMNLCYRCLIRPKEIRMLKIKHINYIDGVIDMPPEISKNHHERIIPLPDELMEYMIHLKDCNGEHYIFSGGFKPGKKPMSPHQIGNFWAQMRDELKLPASYQFYSLKDTGITEMLEAGVPAKYVKELADHHSLEMTERYTHKSEAKKILEWNKLEF